MVDDLFQKNDQDANEEEEEEEEMVQVEVDQLKFDGLGISKKKGTSSQHKPTAQQKERANRYAEEVDEEDIDLTAKEEFELQEEE